MLQPRQFCWAKRTFRWLGLRNSWQWTKMKVVGSSRFLVKKFKTWPHWQNHIKNKSHKSLDGHNFFWHHDAVVKPLYCSQNLCAWSEFDSDGSDSRLKVDPAFCLSEMGKMSNQLTGSRLSYCLHDYIVSQSNKNNILAIEGEPVLAISLPSQ